MIEINFQFTSKPAAFLWGVGSGVILTLLLVWVLA